MRRPIHRTLRVTGLVVVLWTVAVLVCWALPAAQLVHAAHFELGAAVRRSPRASHIVLGALHAFMQWLDQLGVARTTPAALEVDVWRRLARERRYRALGEACVDGLHQLYPLERNNAYFHGIKDSWAFWVLMLMQCGVKDCRTLPYDLLSLNLRNTLAWRGLSGSDDVLWATLVLASHPGLVELGYQWSGARGARQLYAEAETHYVHIDAAGHTLLFWDTNKRYTATISVTLWIASSARLYELHRDEPRYLRNAQSSLNALLNTPGGAPENALITASGQVNDGRWFSNAQPDTMQWTYNAGAALGALSSLYRTTEDPKYLQLAEAIAAHATDYFFDADGHLAERRSTLNLDQFSFKGLLLYYLDDFCRTLLAHRPSAATAPPAWLVKLRRLVLAHVPWLVEQRLDARRGFCAYWAEPTADTHCNTTTPYVAQSMITASQLFKLADYLDTNVHPPTEQLSLAER